MSASAVRVCAECRVALERYDGKLCAECTPCDPRRRYDEDAVAIAVSLRGGAPLHVVAEAVGMSRQGVKFALDRAVEAFARRAAIAGLSATDLVDAMRRRDRCSALGAIHTEENHEGLALTEKDERGTGNRMRGESLNHGDAISRLERHLVELEARMWAAEVVLRAAGLKEESEAA